MDKITAIGMQARQQAMLDRMHNTAAVASSGGLNSTALIAPGSDLPGVTGAGQPSFSQVLNNAIDNVDAMQHAAGEKQQAIELGRSDDLAGAMIESQKASVAFSAMLQVRNKLTTALDEVMNTPL
ncbi:MULTISPECIES: flagellar hook-basal body complex protein FliE [Pantoea]|jgi:flagellar hook-basal body complex protein FliE|uniref:Flagellar hook-basal body complex protein FliE n=1 Tax=Pantoea brenneri TaxID=472694 RepID=A0A7Y6NHL3_9GAMM|nr:MULTISPECIES: flagellar hook-basal body complex protein FliE [Pantoea]MBZ6397197.1 flagellar hook-basal body complex protein FliE [Pantoea sp.]MBZ6440424.1 flagellar hook-basal body complex protein FliE [Pantoea sp.]MDU4127772.1 flagellar hook-basal body complex protein FliE [Pantoea sp.]MDU7869928.1 flagellar hook-basal body complex protein FliE [Pantoea sp.]NUY43693.1 flagellar hook-basal body complex protein FliE [Pantoea brenneri]